MASSFGANPQVAADVARTLSTIRSDLTGLGSTFASYRGASGSTRIDAALDNFFADCSDSRDAMDKLLQRAAGLLNGLATGTKSVDTSLANALDTKPGSTPRPAPTPTSGPR